VLRASMYVGGISDGHSVVFVVVAAVSFHSMVVQLSVPSVLVYSRCRMTQTTEN